MYRRTISRARTRIIFYVYTVYMYRYGRLEILIKRSLGVSFYNGPVEGRGYDCFAQFIKNSFGVWKGKKTTLT